VSAAWTSYVHVLIGYPIDLFLLLTPFVLAWALWPRRLARFAIACGVIGVAYFGFFFLLSVDAEDGPVGLVERLGFGVIHQWVGLVAIGLLLWSGAQARPPEARAGAGPLEPFRFLLPRMTGSGEMTYSWWSRIFRLPRRFSYDRRVDYDGSALWVMHDTLRYEGDWLRFDRTMFATPRSAQRMHLTADDMPGGGETDLFPGGLVLEPTWFLTPYWGVPWPMRGRGVMHLDGEDAFDASLAFDFLGFVPFARMRFRLERELPKNGPRA
jgi:hypothetical protein